MSVINNIYPPRLSLSPCPKELYGGQPKLKQHGSWYETRLGWLPVQARPSGWMPKPMKAIGERFCDALEHHSQLLVARFDLHLPSYTEDNAEISEFMSKLNYWIKKRFKGVKEVKYVWAREHEKAKQRAGVRTSKREGCSVARSEPHPSPPVAGTRRRFGCP